MKTASINNASIWFDEVPDTKAYPTFTGETRADVVVVGGGITGVLTAWRLVQKGLNVVLLEKNHIGTGDTGATTGFLIRVPDTSVNGLIKEKGAEFVERLFGAAREAQTDIFEIIKTNNIDCDFISCESYYGSYKVNDSTLSGELTALRTGDQKVETISQKPYADFPFAEAIHFKDEGKWHSRKFLFGLLKHTTSKNLRVFEESEVISVDIAENVTVETRQGEIKAKKVVLAMGNPAGLFPELEELVHPKITYVVTARFEKSLQLPDLYWDTLDPYFYYRMADDHTLIVGGGDIDADKTESQKPFAKLTQFIADRFGSDFAITNQWSGTIFHTADGLPYVFSHPHAGGKLFIATGYGGNGMIGSVLASLVLGELVFGDLHDASDLLSYRRTDITIPPLSRKPKQSVGVKQFVTFGATNEFTDKKRMLCKVVGGAKIVVFKIKDKYYAINNTCTHAGGSLCDGSLADETIIQCPLHGAKFDVTSGAVMAPPAIRPVETYAVRVTGDTIEVEVDVGGEPTPPEPKKTYWRQLGIFSVFALLFGGLEIGFQYLSGAAKGDVITSLVRGCAFAGTTLISIALFSSAIFKWFPKTADYWRFRRYCGVAGFTFIAGHVLSVLYLVGFDLAALYFSFNPFQNPIIFGAIGFSIFLPMALTSTDWAVNKLTFKWWKRLHRLVYVAYLSSIFHFISINPPEIKTLPGYVLLTITGLALFGQLFWFVKTAKEAKFKSWGTLIGSAIITTAIVGGYFVYKVYFTAT